MASKVQQALGRPLTDAQLASAIRRGSVGVVRETGHTLYSAGLVKYDRPASSGLYYYALPSSRDKLDLGKVLSARNKVDAALLLGMPEKTVAKEAGYKRDGWKLQGYSEAGFLEVVRKYDPRSVLDQFDRPIAQAAKKQGYDTIILHREATGHGSLATEVVDLARVRVNPKKANKMRNPTAERVGQIAGVEVGGYTASMIPTSALPDSVNKIAMAVIASGGRRVKPGDFIVIEQGKYGHVIGNMNKFANKSEGSGEWYIGLRDGQWFMIENGRGYRITPITHESALILANSYFQQRNPKKEEANTRKAERDLTKFVDKLKGWGVSPKLELEEGGKSAFIFMTGGPWWGAEVKNAQDLYDKVLYPTGKKTGFFQAWDIVDIKAEKSGKRLTGEFIVRVGPSEAHVGEFIKRGLGRSRKTRPETEKYMRGGQSDIFASMRKHMRHGPGGFARGEDPTLDNPKKRATQKTVRKSNPKNSRRGNPPLVVPRTTIDTLAHIATGDAKANYPIWKSEWEGASRRSRRSCGWDMRFRVTQDFSVLILFRATERQLSFAGNSPISAETAVVGVLLPMTKEPDWERFEKRLGRALETEVQLSTSKQGEPVRRVSGESRSRAMGEMIQRGLHGPQVPSEETEAFVSGGQGDVFAGMRKHMRHGPGGFARGEDPTLDNPKKTKNPESLVPVAHGKGRVFDTDRFQERERADAQFIYEGRRTLIFETPDHFFNVIITLDRHPRTTGELRDEVAITLVKSEMDVDVIFEELYPPTGSDDERVQRYLKEASAWLKTNGPRLMRKRIHAVNPKASEKLSWVQDHTGIYMAEHDGGGLTCAGQRGDLVVARSTRGWDVVFEPFGGVAIDLGSAKTLTAGKRKAEIAITGKKAKKKAKKKAARKATPEWQRLINRCQKLWEHYCERPGKKRLKEVLAHLEKMKSSTSTKVNAERRRCLRSARAEARKLKVKV